MFARFAPRILPLAVALTVVCSCAFVKELLSTGGEKQISSSAPPANPVGPHVLIFAMDGAVPAEFETAVKSGKAPHIALLLGKERGDGIFDHAYAAPHALSVLPSSTIADWSAMFTGSTPAYDGVPGDEWFDRATMEFLAPVPVSVPDTADNAKVVTDDLIGRQLKVPTLFEKVHVRSYVSLLSVYRGATVYTIVAPAALLDLTRALIRGFIQGDDPEKSLSASIDRDSVDKILELIDRQGLADLQVVYFPGIDIFTHAARDPLKSQARYLEHVTDPAVGRILDEYLRRGVLDNTYVIFISDHAHIPTNDDEKNEIGIGDDDSPYTALSKGGFRVRRPTLLLPSDDDNYQAVIAYQGFMAYVYLADRSTCRDKHAKCSWKRPPRVQEDLFPALRAFYKSNMVGRPVRRLKGTIDLIFARPGVRAGQNSLPFMIFDGDELVSIHQYLEAHPRPDLVDLEERMNWLSAGPYGDRAGDILLLARACKDLPIAKRFYFSGVTHYSWHGSACEQDSHIPFVLAKRGADGEEMRKIMSDFGGAAPSERELTPLVEYLLTR